MTNPQRNQKEEVENMITKKENAEKNEENKE